MSKKFVDADRYNYPDLGPESLIWDVGAHKGAFARTMSEKYGCTIWCFEPTAVFYDHLRDNCHMLPKVYRFRYALGAFDGVRSFGIKGDMSGGFTKDTDTFENVTFQDVAKEINGISRMVDLLKVNIEGGEYELFDRINASNIAPRFRHIQIQFHGTGTMDPNAHREAIRKRLARTHVEMYCEPFVWEGWSLK